MGNLVSCGLGHAPSKHVVKLVHCNGLVEEFCRLVRVGELIVNYPHHFICHSDDLRLMCGGSGVPPSLSEDDDMELGQIYFLLPREVLESALTQADIAALLSKAEVARKASYKGSHLPASLPPRPAAVVDMVMHMAYVHEGTSPHVTSVSREFVERVLAETRLQLLQQSNTSNTILSKQQLCNNPELQSAFTTHILAKSCSRLWRPPLETIEEGIFLTA